MSINLDSIVQRGVARGPLRVLFYGVEGIGKTTWAAGAPSPVFLGTEDGFGDLDVARLPSPATWRDALEYVAALTNDRHDFRTLVIDTVDHLESLLHAHLCREREWESIEDPGYGKGYVVALEEFTKFLDALEVLRKRRAMHVILLAHAKLEAYKNPDGPDYDRYVVKCDKRVSARAREWCDCVLFGRLDVTVKSDQKGDKALFRKGKALDTAERVVMTTTTPAFDAKNRFHLPEEIPMAWDAFARGAKVEPFADPEGKIDPTLPWPARLSSVGAIVAHLDARGWLAEAEASIGAPSSEWSRDRQKAAAAFAFGKAHAPYAAPAAGEAA